MKCSLGISNFLEKLSSLSHSTVFLYFFAAAAKSLQSCPTLHNPMDCNLPGSSIHGLQPTRLLHPWDFPGKSTISLQCSLNKASSSLLAILWNSAFRLVYLSLSPLLLFFSQLFVSPPQTTILPCCISFSLVWFWSPSPVQCYEPVSIVLQALCEI